MRFAGVERVEGLRLDLAHHLLDAARQLVHVLGQRAVGHVPVARRAEPQPSQRLDALGAAHVADVACLALPRVAGSTVGRVHDRDLVASRGVVRQHPAGTDHLVVGVGGEHQHRAFERVLGEQRREQVVHASER